MTRFRTFGPFPIADTANKSDALARQFGAVDSRLNDSCGVYIFVDDTSGLPAYVGQTTVNSFGTRLSAHLNGRTSLRSFLYRTPIQASLLIIAPLEDGKLLTAEEVEPHSAAIAKVEALLIGSCYEVNRDLKNVKGLPSYRELHVPGYLNSGPQDDYYDESAKSLNKLLQRRES